MCVCVCVCVFIELCVLSRADMYIHFLYLNMAIQSYQPDLHLLGVVSILFLIHTLTNSKACPRIPILIYIYIL